MSFSKVAQWHRCCGLHLRGGRRAAVDGERGSTGRRWRERSDRPNRADRPAGRDRGHPTDRTGGSDRTEGRKRRSRIDWSGGRPSRPDGRTWTARSRWWSGKEPGHRFA
jgi:hypothetical protein